MDSSEDRRIDRLAELQKLYLRNMNVIKFRLEAISDIRMSKKTTTFQRTNIEFCVLQIRKILELIALSSLVSDADVYKEKLGNIEHMWNAKLIFRDLERIHPDFYPRAIMIDPKDRGTWHDRPEPYLTKEKFIKIYERCGRFLHEDSPFRDEKELAKEYEQVWEDIYDWGQLIINLLYTHTVRLYNQKDLFYISFGPLEDEPCGNIFTLESQEDNDGKNENGVS